MKTKISKATMRASKRRFTNVTLLLSVLLVMFILGGCSKNEEAKVKPEAAPVSAVDNSNPQTPKPSGTLTLSPQNTTVSFLGEKVVGSHEGKFEALSGSISYKNGDPTSAKISVKIDMASVKTDAEKLDGHLKSADFFEVEKFPHGTFESAGVVKGGKDNATHTVNGKVTLRGISKAVSIPANISVGENTVTMTGEFVINRQDFNIAFPGMPDNLIKDSVKISLKIDGKI